MIKSWAVIGRGFFIGYVSGFIPGVTYHLGTTIAYLFERRIKKKKNTYQTGDLDCLVAAETANNSGVFSQIIPLFLIGLPITSSQSFIYSIVESKGTQITTDFFYHMLPYMMVVYMLSAIIGLFIAGKYVNWIRIFSKIDFRYIYASIIAALFVVAYITGAMYGQSVYYVVILLVLIPFGYLLKNYDRTPIVFAFLLHDTLYYSAMTFNSLYL
jgi:TctA family transporter